jgi:uncharacterized RDD family membrane protein YckC
MTGDGAPAAGGRGSALYTPEAVRLDLPLADVGSRTLAILLDLFVMGSLLYVVLLLGVAALGIGLAAGGQDPGWPLLVLVLVLNFLVLWGYPTTAEVLLRGRSAGKAALGLRVVTLEGAPIRFRHAAIRGLFAFVDFYLLLGIPALVSALCTRRGQRLGDLAAGTVVVRDRARGVGDLTVAWQVPPALRAYASTLDVRGLGPADYALVRRFLLRAATLRPEHRGRVALALADAMAARMGHAPPPGTHPEALLVCIAALVQARGGWPGPVPSGPVPSGPVHPGPVHPGPARPLPAPGPPPAPPSARDGFAPPS